jgi:hypothetical protein
LKIYILDLSFWLVTVNLLLSSLRTSSHGFKESTYQTVNISITFGSDFGKIKDLKHKLEI